jgi:hypothetical protein
MECTVLYWNVLQYDVVEHHAATTAPKQKLRVHVWVRTSFSASVSFGSLKLNN